MANHITRAAAARQCQKVLNDMKVETGLLAKVLAFIRGREGVIPSLEQTADYLTMSPHTLRSQLQELEIICRMIANRKRQC